MNGDKEIVVVVQLKDSSQPLTYHRVVNTYQKGDMFVIYTNDEISYKHPMSTIWRVKEEYGYHGRTVPPTKEVP